LNEGKVINLLLSYSCFVFFCNGLTKSQGFLKTYGAGVSIIHINISCNLFLFTS